MKTAISLLGATIPAVLPWLWILLFRAADHSHSISRHKWDLTYDYIVVGAGSAGCVVANRLSEDPTKKILLLEAGGSESAVSEVPQAVFILQKTPIDWQYRTTPQKRCCRGIRDRRLNWPRGKLLGGSSALNYMIYIRGSKRDYDKWAAEGADGWSYDEVLPYFMKAEDNRDPDTASNGYHGRGGPLTVQRSRWISPMAYAFLAAARLLGYPTIDVNGPDQNGFQITQSTLRRSSRCSTARAYLYDYRDRKNLHVVTFAHVTKILFNHNREAVGVQFDRFGKTNRVYASREVIVSAGAINTPQLLMLSGIGPARHLQSLGIPVIADLPVGRNLQDHIFPYGLNFIADDSRRLPGEFWTHIRVRVQTIPNLTKYLTIGRGPVSSNGGLDAMGFVRTSYANKSIPDLADYQINFLSGCLSSDDGMSFQHVVGLTDQMWRTVFKPFVRQQCYTILPVLLKPRSKGYIKLMSTNPYDKPYIEPNYFAHPDDLDSMAEALMISYKMGLAPPFIEKYGVKPSGIVIPGCEPFPLYSFEYMRCMAQTLTATIFHPVGTCKMGRYDDPTTVVDARTMRVKYVRRLRVVDGSVMPDIVSGNTNAPIIMIGEKSADIIKGIKRTPRVMLDDYIRHGYANNELY